jgi:glutamate synthase (NADPH/NADH) large chain/glutamate synthase (ferredoxin)
VSYPLVRTDSRADCGTGFIAESSGVPSRRVVTLALSALGRLLHRGARAADDETGDGAGLMTDLPQPLFRSVVEDELGGSLLEGETLAVAMAFTSEAEAAALESALERTATELGMRYLGRRAVPVRPDCLGRLARSCMPLVVQLFVGCPEAVRDVGEWPLESRLYLLRKRVERLLAGLSETFICSLSSRTIVYKGLLTPRQLERFYPDLGDERYKSRVAVFHERYATNTAPSWALAQPFRLIAHNGEINTVKGNRLWMRARQREMRSAFWGEELEALRPITGDGGSDSLSLDNVLEFLLRSGRSLFQGLMLMIPDPYQDALEMAPELRDFFIYHENLMQAWDGPAALVFTDGEVAGAKLDRNGLRPLRYTLTRDGLVIMASEAGVVDVDEADLVLNHHMASGEIFAVRLDGSGLLGNDQIKRTVARTADYSKLVHSFAEIWRGAPETEFGDFVLPLGGFDRRLRVALGWSREDLSRFVLPMARSGREPLGSMGDDTPPAVLARNDTRLYDYFKQAFAQVTNPPIDPIREAFVTGLHKYLGSEENLLAAEPRPRRAIRIAGPVLSPRELQLLYDAHDWFPHATIYCHVDCEQSLAARIDEICRRSADAVAAGRRIIFLSDENLFLDEPGIAAGDERTLPIPMPLVVSAVHHELIRRRSRSAVSLVCLAGDVVSDHHVACLVAMGASAVYPYMAYELVREHFAERSDWPELMANYRLALEKGLLKIMAKLGISTVSSYHGSMNELLERYFPSIGGQLGGVGLDEIRRAALTRCRHALGEPAPALADLGHYRFRRRGELHAFAPESVRSIRDLAQSKPGFEKSGSPAVQLRDLLEVRYAAPSAPRAAGGREPWRRALPVDEVEPAEGILARFGAGAMSFGAVSDETHRTLARGFHLVGGRSSSGEGGESPDRYAPGRRDQSANCFIKQIASGRFGVTTDYLASARELQIKMAQGAKPGEGGQLPGHKVTLEIASARAATPGVPLISPPPHHDIYSIEDLAQLIYDLKEVNPRCRVSVKLVAQPGIGTVACGVVKGGADVVLVSGGDGGTGASPLGSLKHTGFPWELSLAETHQALTASGLRTRARLRVDGGLKSGRDVIVAALLGAEEFDFGTAALVALGCVMARQCHLNTCPVGIATQNPELRSRFRGTPERLAAYLRSVADQVRERLARLGAATLEEIVGRSDLLRKRDAGAGRSIVRELDLDPILNPEARGGLPLERDGSREHRKSAELSLDEDILEQVRPQVLTHGQAVVHRAIRNTDRAVGTRLSGELAFLCGAGNFRGRVQLRLRGVAGQSLGAFLTDGVELRLRGLTNDYVGKGMSGGLIMVRMPREVRETGQTHTVLGNVALYGATGGTLLVAGRAGERFAVRNSGASAVVEGIGNHGCEYMTRGTVIVLGEVGRNFGAGMTGGVAYLRPSGDSWREHLNADFVRAEMMSPADEDVVLRLLRQHVFHCGSPIVERLLEDWEAERSGFFRIVPLAQDIVDFRAVYDQQVAARMGVLLNE